MCIFRLLVFPEGDAQDAFGEGLHPKSMHSRLERFLDNVLCHVKNFDVRLSNLVLVAASLQTKAIPLGLVRRHRYKHAAEVRSVITLHKDYRYSGRTTEPEGEVNRCSVRLGNPRCLIRSVPLESEAARKQARGRRNNGSMPTQKAVW